MHWQKLAQGLTSGRGVLAGLRWGPGAEGVFGEVAGLAFGGQVPVAGLGGALAERRAQLVMPLADPGHDLKQPGQQPGQAAGVPAVRGAALADQLISAVAWSLWSHPAQPIRRESLSLSGMAPG